jgi:anti-sigma B factor antagonist
MAADALQVEISESDDCIVCEPIGELDAFSVPGFREQLASLRDRGPVVIDLAGVPFMDSSGLGALIGGIRRIRDAGGSVAVVCDRPAVLRLLHTTGFDRIVSVSSTRADAIASASATD